MTKLPDDSLPLLYGRAFFLLLLKKQKSLQVALQTTEALITFCQTKEQLFFRFLLQLNQAQLQQELLFLFQKKVELIWLNLMLVLVDENSFSLFLDCLLYLEKLLLAKLGVKSALLYSTYYLAPSQLALLQKKLEKKYACPFKLINKLDKKLLAGFVLEFEGMVWDNSYYKQLLDLQKVLSKRSTIV